MSTTAPVWQPNTATAGKAIKPAVVTGKRGK